MFASRLYKRNETFTELETARQTSGERTLNHQMSTGYCSRFHFLVHMAFRVSLADSFIWPALFFQFCIPSCLQVFHFSSFLCSFSRNSAWACILGVNVFNVFPAHLCATYLIVLITRTSYYIFAALAFRKIVTAEPLSSNLGLEACERQSGDGAGSSVGNAAGIISQPSQTQNTTTTHGSTGGIGNGATANRPQRSSPNPASCTAITSFVETFQPAKK